MQNDKKGNNYRCIRNFKMIKYYGQPQCNIFEIVDEMDFVLQDGV